MLHFYQYPQFHKPDLEKYKGNNLMINETDSRILRAIADAVTAANSLDPIILAEVTTSSQGAFGIPVGPVTTTVVSLEAGAVVAVAGLAAFGVTKVIESRNGQTTS